ncbi:TPA: ATP-binding protein [Enterobacter cloacae]|uniref:ATP-binding protein n=1 Tax=Gammaproteobacteria TaxID=1236 RepID=UPI00053E8AB2|nr:ATP-binding protein [Pseudomonas aeruginosa]EKY1502698.1 ATP-binding protein [Enterobacter cloacae]
MGTIRLKTNQHRLISNLRHAFNPQSMLGELLQNARRAGAKNVHITVDDDAITVCDDGSGIADLQSLIHIAESGWDPELQARENAFGMGVLSTLYFSRHLSVHSGTQAFSASTATIIRGDGIEVYAEKPRIGTEIRLDGVQSPTAGVNLPVWAEQQLKRLCEAFPVPVFLNGMELARPLTDPSLPWRETPVGRILLNLEASCVQWQCFLQGLPIGLSPRASKHHVVVLRDDMIARLPDRQHLLNEADECVRIRDAINQAYRQALIETRERLPASEFIEHYAERCLSSSNADLLNDIHFVPLAWFRDWHGVPPGYVRFWERYLRTGISASEALNEAGVWRIANGEDNDETAAEVYLSAREGFLLEETRLDAGHWLMSMVRTIDSAQVVIQHAATLYEDRHTVLADGSVSLVLVEGLCVSLEAEPGEYPVAAVRRADTLYLTTEAYSVTRLVSDYIFNDRYEEASEEEDGRTISTFIAVGCSQDPVHVIGALLPDTLRYTPQSRLAGATVRLVFDDEGKLQTITG